MHIIISLIVFAYAVYIEETMLQVGALLWLLISLAFSFMKLTPQEQPKPQQAPQKPHPLLNGKVVAYDPEFHCAIAGVQQRNTVEDVGAFLGFVKPDPNNPYDPNAVGIYTNDRRHVGYISHAELGKYRRWATKEVLPCVGFIKEGDEVPLFGKVKVMDTDTEEVELITAQYVRWMVNNFGLNFIPADFNIDPAPTSKQNALAILDEYIESKEADLYEEETDE